MSYKSSLSLELADPTELKNTKHKIPNNNYTKNRKPKPT